MEKIIPIGGEIVTKGSNKGSANEREKAKIWSLWWTRGSRSDVFWRVGGSGGRATVRTKLGKETAAQYGDMISLDPIGEPLLRICTIELKKGYTRDIDFLGLLDGKSKNHIFWKFWLKLKSDCEAAGNASWGEEPLLIIHRDFRNPVICMRGSLYREICASHKFSWNQENKVIMISNGAEEIVCFKLELFFELASPEFFITKWKKKKNESQISGTTKLPGA